MRKEIQLFNIGDTPAKVRITHARRFLLYFIKTLTDFEISPHQEMLIDRLMIARHMGMKEAHKRNYGKRRNKMEKGQTYKVTHEFFIAGVQFHQLKNVINDLAEGDHLALIPEPSNKFDPNAVRIEYEKAAMEKRVMIGFVPKKFSSEVCAMLDIGKGLECILVELNRTAKTWEQAKVEIRKMS